uniref:Uncharacterized protein n=1 Tax=Glossina brevipalpis TaxID=37001 RepID=A0A1A9W987_9MUSC
MAVKNNVLKFINYLSKVQISFKKLSSRILDNCCEYESFTARRSSGLWDSIFSNNGHPMGGSITFSFNLYGVALESVSTFNELGVVFEVVVIYIVNELGVFALQIRLAKTSAYLLLEGLSVPVLPNAPLLSLFISSSWLSTLAVKSSTSLNNILDNFPPYHHNIRKICHTNTFGLAQFVALHQHFENPIVVIIIIANRFHDMKIFRRRKCGTAATVFNLLAVCAVMMLLLAYQTEVSTSALFTPLSIIELYLTGSALVENLFGIFVAALSDLLWVVITVQLQISIGLQGAGKETQVYGNLLEMAIGIPPSRDDKILSLRRDRPCNLHILYPLNN